MIDLLSVSADCRRTPGVALGGAQSFAMWTMPMVRLSSRTALAATIVITLTGCWLISAIIDKPIPRIHDEFSYVLMGETLREDT